MAIGDSKSLTPLGNGYAPQLAARGTTLPAFAASWANTTAILYNTGVYFDAWIAKSGYQTATLRTEIDGYLAAANAPRVDWVLYEMGTNDSLDGPTWQADTLYIVDAIHAKWPSAQIKLVKEWNSCQYFAYESEREAVIAARPTFCSDGIDQGVVLGAGDCGATYTSDGIHPNAAGALRMAQAWKALLGL